ncbi:MAG: Pepco domain-containing protein [Desulfobacteria bacterium]
MSDNNDSIIIFTGGELAAPSAGVRRGLRNGIEATATKASGIAVSTLQENMRRFLSSLDTIIGSSPKDVGGLTLDEVEIHVQIDGKGNVGISGIVEAEFAAQGGIKFVLRKKV